MGGWAELEKSLKKKGNLQHGCWVMTLCPYKSAKIQRIESM